MAGRQHLSSKITAAGGRTPSITQVEGSAWRLFVSETAKPSSHPRSSPALLQVLDGKRLAAAAKGGEVGGQVNRGGQWRQWRHPSAEGTSPLALSTLPCRLDHAARQQDATTAAGGARAATTATAPLPRVVRAAPRWPHPLIEPGARTSVSPFRSAKSILVRLGSRPSDPGTFEGRDAGRSRRSALGNHWLGWQRCQRVPPPPPATHSSAHRSCRCAGPLLHLPAAPGMRVAKRSV